MKRTNKLKLTLMLGASAGLSGCTDPEEPALLFTDVDDCTDFGVERDVCQAQYHRPWLITILKRQSTPMKTSVKMTSGLSAVSKKADGIIMAGFMIAAVAEAVDEFIDLMKKKKKRKKNAFLGGNY